MLQLYIFIAALLVSSPSITRMGNSQFWIFIIGGEPCWFYKPPNNNCKYLKSLAKVLWAHPCWMVDHESVSRIMGKLRFILCMVFYVLLFEIAKYHGLSLVIKCYYRTWLKFGFLRRQSYISPMSSHPKLNFAYDTSLKLNFVTHRCYW